MISQLFNALCLLNLLYVVAELMETDYVLRLKQQTRCFTQLFDIIKEVDNDKCNIVFGSGSIKFGILNNSKDLLFCSRLDSKNFIYYKCDKEINFGIDIKSFIEVLQYYKEDDIIEIFIPIDYKNSLYFFSDKTYVLKYVQKINLPTLSIPRAEFNRTFMIKTSEFYDMFDLFGNNYIELQVNDKNCVFTNTITNNNKIIDFHYCGIPLTNSYKMVYNFIVIKNIIKAAIEISPNIHGYIKNDFALVITFPLLIFGRIDLFLTPIICEKNEPAINGSNEKECEVVRIDDIKNLVDSGYEKLNSGSNKKISEFLDELVSFYERYVCEKYIVP